MANAAALIQALSTDRVNLITAATSLQNSVYTYLSAPTASNLALVGGAVANLEGAVIQASVDVNNLAETPLGQRLLAISGALTLVAALNGAKQDLADINEGVENKVINVGAVIDLAGNLLTGIGAAGQITIEAGALAGITIEGSEAAAVAAGTLTLVGGAESLVSNYASQLKIPVTWWNNLVNTIAGNTSLPSGQANTVTGEVVITGHVWASLGNGIYGGYVSISSMDSNYLDLGSDGSIYVIRNSAGAILNLIVIDDDTPGPIANSGGLTMQVPDGAGIAYNSSIQTLFVTQGGQSTVVPVGAAVEISSNGIQNVDVNGVQVAQQSGLVIPASTNVTNVILSGVGANIGDVIGSSIGNVLANGNAAEGVLYTSLIGQVGSGLAAIIQAGSTSTEQQVEQVAQNVINTFGNNVGNALASNGAGTISSVLFIELGQDLGLPSFANQLIGNVAGSVVSKVVSNVLQYGTQGIWAGFTPTTIYGTQYTGGSVSPNVDIENVVGNAIGSFLGTKLGALIYSPQTAAGEALATIGSAVGSFLTGSTTIGADAVSFIADPLIDAAADIGGEEAGWLAGDVLLPGIGALVGFVLGALIGDLFGAKPKIPTASADTILAIPAATYVVGNETSANGGDLGIATEMADTARDTLNGIIAQITSNDPNAIVQNTSSPTQDYGYDSGGLYVKLNGAKTYYSSADQAVNAGVMWALPQTQIIGGDIFLKRAIANGSTTDLTTLMGDLQIASDYEFYTNNRALINSEITAAYATLSSSEMTFYDNNKALVDQVDMSGVSSLNSSQLSIYNANLSAFADIIQALQAQSVANPWIVTLESASELKLDQWSPSDFYGGIQGFFSSFGVGEASSGVGYEDISLSWNGSALVASINGPGIAQTTSDPQSPAAQIYLLYEGIFGSAPAPGGWTYWLSQLENGVPITSIANSFISIGNVGTGLDNAQFIEYPFKTALHRGAGDPNTDYWVQALNNGSISRALAATGISESQEAQGDSASAIDAGLNYLDAPGLNLFSSLTQSSPDGRSLNIDGFTTSLGYAVLAPGSQPYANTFESNAGSGSAFNLVDYSNGNNIFIGGDGGNTITAGSGHDWIQGGAGTDVIIADPFMWKMAA